MPDATALRAARQARGWSLTDAAGQLTALGAERGVPVASSRSLRSQLSRWENGHATPDAAYRALLAELLDRSPAALGIEPLGSPTAEVLGSPTERLRAALAGAPTLDGQPVQRWREQLTAVERLDDELGAAAAEGIVAALVERLDRLLEHTIPRQARAAVAEVLSGAAALAGAQALDRTAVDEAWRHYARARTAAREAGGRTAGAIAVSGQVDVLVEIGEAERARALLDDAHADPALDGHAARAHLEAASGLVHASVGRAAEALAALARAGAERTIVPVDRFRPPGVAIEVADLHRWRGHALRLLGDAGAATELEHALAAGPRSVRHRVEVLADLAAALAAADPRASARRADEARSLGRRIGSTRTATRLPPETTGRVT